MGSDKINGANVNKELAQELHKLVTKKNEKKQSLRVLEIIFGHRILQKGIIIS